MLSFAISEDLFLYCGFQFCKKTCSAQGSDILPSAVVNDLFTHGGFYKEVLYWWEDIPLFFSCDQEKATVLPAYRDSDVNGNPPVI